MEAVARNIYHFFHVILVKAHDEPIWTRNSLHRSIQWAKYCEKVHDEAISKGYGSCVAMMLKDMSRLTPDRRAVTFDDLKLASRLLVAELLQCPVLRKGTVQIILESELAHEPWLEVMCEIFVVNSILKELDEEKEEKQPEHDRDLETLKERLSGLSGHALDKQLDLLSRNSPETLLKLVSCEDDRSCALSCSTGLWVARRLAVDDSVSVSVWNQESGLLCKAACRSPSLMQCLLQRLQAHARMMEPSFLVGADEWVLTRNSPAGAWDWKRVTEIWTALKQTAECGSSSLAFAAFLNQEQRGSHRDFWDDLVFYSESAARNGHANITKAVDASSSVDSSLLLRECCH